MRPSITFGIITEIKANFPYMNQSCTCYLENGIKFQLPIFKRYINT